ncbi:MAG TPA: DUF6569 family protein [Polyangiales bacterium]|nr:DUF6569 family protein [Polyangiales bacterium]
MQAKTLSRSKRISVQLCLAFAIASAASATAPEVPAAHIGEPLMVENLTIFPVHGEHEAAPIALTTLDAALAKGDAVVSELSDGGEVNRLHIRNKGKRAIYVLAGTVVKGGKQDRQIGQDFVIEQGKKVAVDAFCVEQGRWTAQREGRATDGKFSATKGLAQSSVRRAAQYERNQGEVWSKVSEVNAAHKKDAPSGTLMATLDDAGVAKRRAALVTALDAALRTAETQSPVVGLGYAVDGQVRNVRWFQSQSAFALFRTTLLESAALDALTAQGLGSKRSAPKVEAAAVDAFISDVETGAAETRETDAQNRNEYREGKAGFGSKTRLKSAPRSAAPISSDYTAK